MKYENDRLKQRDIEVTEEMERTKAECREAIIDARRKCIAHCNDKLRRMHYL